MSLFKMKRGQESKVDSLAKEDGSLIFSLNGANDSTLRLDQSVSGTVQRLGVAVDKAKDANSVIDYNESTRHIKIGYAGAGLSTANLTHIAGYTNNGTQIKDVSKDVLKSWLGTMGSADSAKVIEPFENATADASRNVWFSDSGKRNKPVYNDNFKYNPVSKILTTNISGSAAKWTTARTVTLNGDLSGSFSIDGSGNVSANIYDYYSTVQVGNTNNYPYHRIAKLDTISGSYVDKSTLLYLSQGYQGGRFGIIRVSLRTNNVSGGAKSGVEARWLIRSGFNTDDIKIGHYSVAGKTYADVFYRSNSSYAGCVIRDLGSSSRNNIGRCWTLVNSRETENTTTSDKKTSTECWATIELAGKDLHNQAYSEIISSSDGGTVSYANNSGALGGSSLSQVLASAGGGNAFTSLDTTTSNKIKLTRANGGTVEKTINNVSNASSASFASTATLASTATNASTANYAKSAAPSAGSLNYVQVLNSSKINGSASYTVNELAKHHFAQGMINAATDNPLGKTGWVHVQSMAWTNGSDQWASQLALDVQNGSGMYYRSSAAGGHLAGRSWNKLLDNTNYTDYAADRTAFSGVSISGRNITLTRANGETVKITTQDSNTTYPVHEGVYDASFASSFRSESFGTVANGWHLAAVRTDVANVSYAPQYGSGIAWARGDTHGYLYVDYSGANAYIGGGNANRLNWQKQLAFLDSTVANATSAKNASHLGGKVASDYALKTDLSGNINALSAKRLPSYQSVSVANSFFYRYGTAGNTSDGGAWTGFPSTTLYNAASTVNGFGNALFQKKVGVLHLAAGSSAHDLVFQAGGTNGGIAYVATGRNPAYVLDTLNYKDKAYTFNKLTATSTFTATSGVVIDGGSY